MTDGGSTTTCGRNIDLGNISRIERLHDGSMREAICKSITAGVTYVAAAGNSTVDASTYVPAAFPEVIGSPL